MGMTLKLDRVRILLEESQNCNTISQTHEQISSSRKYKKCKPLAFDFLTQTIGGASAVVDGVGGLAESIIGDLLGGYG